LPKIANGPGNGGDSGPYSADFQAFFAKKTAQSEYNAAPPDAFEFQQQILVPPLVKQPVANPDLFVLFVYCLYLEALNLPATLTAGQRQLF